MTSDEQRYLRDLERDLAEARATVEALLSGQIDAVVDGASQTPVLLAQAQEALRAERDLAQHYLDTPDVLLLALDLEGRITLINRYGCSVLGWSAADLIGRDWFDTCRPVASPDAGREMLTRMLRGELPVFENPVRTRGGAERRIEWRNTVLTDEDGRVVGTFSAGADITERHHAAEALRVAEERTRFAFEAAGVGIWDMDPATGAVQWSATLEAQYGLAPGTFEGTIEAFLGHVHFEDRQAVAEVMERAMATGDDFVIQHRAERSDGPPRWLDGKGRFHLDGHGRAVRGLGISLDVTDRRALEAQYRQAQKMEAVGQLAAGVAHDFNNLLTVIVGFTELVVADSALPAQHGRDLREAITAAHSATGLTRQLLAFSRQQVLRPVPLDLNKVVTEMTAMLGRLIGVQIGLEVALAPRLSLTLADRGQLEQVLMNLLVNARDAMPEGGRVTITTRDVELENALVHDEPVPPGAYVLLSIADTGLGMSLETKRRLFEPFYTTKESGRGTGLGLSTCYGIVKQSKGYITVDSEPGRGTTFNVYLPVCHLAAMSQSAAPVATVAPAARAGGETVLLVDDNDALRHLAMRMLGDAGFRVIEAATAEAAELLFERRAGEVDLLVTDVNMPGHSGPELLRRLRLRVPALKALFVSGYAAQGAARTASDADDVPFMQKPFTGAQLVREVRAVLDR